MQTDFLKGLCHEMDILLKAYNNNYLLSVQVLKVFAIFCCLVKFTPLKLLSLKILIVIVTRFKDPKAEILKMLTGSRL